MKFFVITILLFIFYSKLHSQTVIIPEGDSTVVCGSSFEFVRVEYSAGRIFARVNVDGDEKIFIPGDRYITRGNCNVFIGDITKDGKLSRGSLILEDTKSTESRWSVQNSISISGDTMITVKKSSLSISNNYPFVKLESKLTNMLSVKQEIGIAEGDTLWLSGIPYGVVKIAVSENGITSVNLLQLTNAISRYEIESIPEYEDNFKLYMTDKENLLIRKFYYSPYKREQPDIMSICLIRLLPGLGTDHPIAMPVWEVERDGKKYYIPFEVLKIFDTKEEAISFAIEHDITDIDIDRE